MTEPISPLDDATKSSFVHSWWFYLLIANAIIGVAMLEYSWKRIERFRKPIKEVEQLFPAFRRDDAKQWRKWMHYPGAMTMLVPRALVLVVVCLSMGMIMTLLVCCYDQSKPKSWLRRNLIRCVHSTGWRIISFFSLGCWQMYKYIEADYSEYLGTSEHQPVGASIGRQ
jgi:hypothetical protein